MGGLGEAMYSIHESFHGVFGYSSPMGGLGEAMYSIHGIMECLGIPVPWVVGSGSLSALDGRLPELSSGAARVEFFGKYLKLPAMRTGENTLVIIGCCLQNV